MALIFGLSATVQIGLVGGGIDYARLTYRKSELQSAVDRGVLAGGNALKLASSSLDSVRGVTEQTIRDAAKPAPDRPFTLSVEVPAEKTSVSARAEETIRFGFGALVGLVLLRSQLRPGSASSARCACVCSHSMRERPGPSI